MWLPMRYATSSPSVKSSRLRSSAIANRFLTLSMAMCLQSFCRAASRRELLRGLGAELVRAHRQPFRNFTAAEYLHPLRRFRHQPALAQQIERHDRARVEPLAQRIEIHHGVLDAERVVKPALRHAPLERHLAAFEAPLALEARARFRALVSTPRLRALARAMTAADALLRMLGPLGRLQI